MHQILSLSVRAVLLSLAVVILMMPGAFAAPAPGAGAAQGIGGVEQPSPPKQLKLMRDKYQFIDAYYNTRTTQPVREVFQRKDGVQKSSVNLLDGEQYREKTAPGASPTRVEATGWILPTGYYWWDGRLGIVPNPTMAMPGFMSPIKVKDSGMIGPTMGLLDAVDPTHALRTTTITNGDFARIMAAKGEMMNQLRADPSHWRSTMASAMNTKQNVQANNTAREAERNSDAAWATVAMPLINIANEDAWQPCDPKVPFKSYANAAWMVGRMYKEVYIPMAILLLLPGAVLTQVKVIVNTGFSNMNPRADEDMVSPFSGIMRAIIAIFLIPATQLMISYCIDVGNSLTYELVNCPYWDLQMLEDWRNHQTYEAFFDNQLNYFENTSEADMQGKAFNTPEETVKQERQNYLTSTNQQWFNTLNALLSQGMLALNAFQLVIVMYLFLLGPVAAALFAWPGVGRELFKIVYSNWMDGVVLVTLWKFWWALILLTMMVRIQVNGDLGGYQDDQFEMFMCASFCALLMYVPFNPFNFRPGDTVAQVLDQAQAQTPKGGSGAAVVGSAGVAGGSGAGGHQGSMPGKGPSGTGHK